MKNTISVKQFQFFPFHLVTPSPWPILVSFSLLTLTTGAVSYIHGYYLGGYILSLGFIITTLGMSLWLRDIITEGTLLGDHTKEVVVGLVYGIVLFIVSEVFAFFSIFWAFFHSSLSPAIELGGQWPPLGIEPLNPFAIPLLNTLLLLSSGATITFAHHGLLASKRGAAILGTLLTIILALIFTGLQAFEYAQSSITIADSVYGSAFFCSTGLHGLTLIVPTKFINFCKVKKIQYLSKKIDIILNSKSISTDTKKIFKKDKLLIQFVPFGKKIKTFYLESEFLEWLSGFTDAEGNFNISLRNFINDKYNNVTLTFQIGLHIDDLNLLQFIKEKLNCGHISISGSRCNYFVNDQASLINVILPIFKFVKLNSSKYYQYLTFEKAINLIKNKKHLSSKGKLEMIKYFHEIKISSLAPASNEKTNFPLTVYWLGGFIDGDGSFSIGNNAPRLKFENHIKELELFKRIKEFLNLSSANLNIIPPRKNRINSSTMVVFEINKIHVLKNIIVPLFSKFNILQSKKLKDFNDWSILVNIYYFGYHLLPEGIYIINEIKNRWNNFRLSTFEKLNKNEKIITFSAFELSFENKLNNLFLLPTPYEVKNGVRFIRGTNNLVSESLKIISIDIYNKKSVFSSVTECSKALHIDRSKIKKCLLTGEKYKNYKIILG